MTNSEITAPRGDRHKQDGDKPDWSLLPLRAVEQIVRVMGFGAKKYWRGGWKTVPDAHDRYIAAAMRHITERQDGFMLDKESRLPVLAHAACCLLFALWFDLKIIPPVQTSTETEND